jgi:hypothetical protein
MVFDRNPKYGADQSFRESALRVTDLLWETTGGEPAAFPQSYLENLRYEYENGKVSMLELIDRIDLPLTATYDDYAEVVERLICVSREDWPEPNSVERVRTDILLSPNNYGFSETEDFGEEDGDMSAKIEKFLKKIIATAYHEGVLHVTDKNGNPPNAANNFLLSKDGTRFSGTFHGRNSEKIEILPFSISESNGKWKIEY